MEPATLGDPMHFHEYCLDPDSDQYRLRLAERVTTDTAGIATCLGLQAERRVELEVIVKVLEERLSDRTVLQL